MTSNLGSHEIQRLSADPETNDRELIKEAVMMEVRKQFRPEFINRIDEVVVFNALDAKHIASIAKIQLQDLETRLQQRNMTLSVSDSALAEIAKAGFDPVYGARPLRRAIQSFIENPIAKLVLKGRYGEKDVIPVDFTDGQFIFERTVH
jgi:ATP-dependent Clp protease ATP-binding subunit ClpB